MSRSRKKAIIKDIGHRKEDYWRVHRRVNKSICKNFFSSAAYMVESTFFNQESDYFFNLHKFMDMGYEQEEAHYMAYDEMDEVGEVYFKLADNCFREQDEQPEFKDPKVLVNDYHYSDYTIDYEYNLGYKFLRHIGRQNASSFKEKYSRK